MFLLHAVNTTWYIDAHEEKKQLTILLCICAINTWKGSYDGSQKKQDPNIGHTRHGENSKSKKTNPEMGRKKEKNPKSDTLRNLGTNMRTKAWLLSRQVSLVSETWTADGIYSQGTDWLIECRLSRKKQNKGWKYNWEVVTKDNKIKQEITHTVSTAGMPKHDNTNSFIIPRVISPSSSSKWSVSLVGS